MKATVVVPTLNEEKYIRKCLESIIAQTVDTEVIVVDSGSTDATTEIARKLADKVILTEVKNIAYNRQRGLEAASNEIVVSTDADCVHPRDWLEKLTRHFTDECVVGVSGPTIPIPDERVFLDKLCYLIGNTLVRLLHKFGVVWFRGSNSAYRKGVVVAVGGYNTGLLAREDSDLSQRVSQKGKTVFDPGAVVMTSMRRRKSMGWLKAVRYYLDTPISLITKKVYYKKV